MKTPFVQLIIEWHGAEARLVLMTVRPYPPAFVLQSGHLAARYDQITIDETIDAQFPSAGTWAVIDDFVQQVRNQNQGNFPAGAGRIVCMMPPQLALRSWERSLSERQDLRNAAFLRWIAPRGSRPPLLFPFGISVVADHPSSGPDWVNLVFDEFVQRDVPQSVVAGAAPNDALIWHLIGDSPEVASHFLGNYDTPGLMVLQRTRPIDTDPDSLAEAIARGASAALLVVAPEPQGLQFSRMFYRKLFHNEALEVCAAKAQEAADLRPGQYLLVAREGGEWDFLLTRVPAEMALAKGLRPEPTLEPSFNLQAPSRERPAPSRQARAAESLRSAASRALDAGVLQGVAKDLDHINNLGFYGEAHDVAEVARVAAQLDASLSSAERTLNDVSASGPAVRHTRLTLKDQGSPSSTDTPLINGRPYALEVDIAPAPGVAQVSREFDEARLRPLFEHEERLKLHVVVFADASDVTMPSTHLTIELPRIGASTVATFQVTPRRLGWVRLRVAVYHGNALLQSVALEALVALAGADATERPTIRHALDWAASTDLMLLDEQANPVLSVFVNDATDGSHWIGVFAGDDDAPQSLKAGQLRRFDGQDATQRAKNLRDALQAVHGNPDYRYPATRTLSEPEVVKFGVDAMITLAVTGREVWSYLFQSMNDVAPDRLQALRGSIKEQQRGIISVARVSAQWTLPWAALYDYPLDVDHPGDLNVCPVLLKQLAANEWDATGTLTATKDLLGDPAACRAQVTCPLSGPRKALTVCPFGFWGFRNQVDEPLASVSPAGQDQLPKELSQPSFSQSTLIPYSPAAGIRVAAGAFPFSTVPAHQQALETLLGEALQWETLRDQVLKLLYDKHGHHLFYFYCHGVADQSFSIQVGPENSTQNLISPAALDADSFQWAKHGNPQPLVILIACESAAARPEIMHGLIGFLRNVAASGVIGSEITLDTGLGAQWGYGLIAALKAGTSVGEAFLQLRLDLLRHYNPLGLAFSLLAPATLHLCADAAGGGACSRYHRAAAPPAELATSAPS